MVSATGGGGTASLRQSSRTKKPSRRAEEMQQANVVAEPIVSTNSISKSKRQKVSSGNGKGRGEQSMSGDDEKKNEDDGGEYEEDDVDEGDGNSDDEDDSEVSAGEGEEEEEEDEGKGELQNSADVFCVCRKGDNGKPMVFCAECNDWFHFKCVNLTKKVAETLSEYICPACNDTTGKISKTIEDTKGEENVESKTNPESSSPPRRPSLSSKRKSTEEEPTRKRSKSSPSSPPIRKPSNSSIASPTKQTPPEPIRKVSGSQNTSSQAVLKARSDSLRKHALDQLVGIFDAMFAELPVKEEGENDESGQGRKYGIAFEEHLFDLCGERTPMTTIRTAGKLYRDRLRSFLFNLKDKSNATLRQKIATLELPAKDLAAMSNDELANDEIRKEVERRKKENLEQSILKKEKAPLRKLTHKGEIDIEYEVAQSSRLAEEHDQEEREMARSKDDDQMKISMEKGVKEKESNAMSPPAASPPAIGAERRTFTTVQSPTLPFDFTNVWTGETPREEEEEESKEKGDEDVSPTNKDEEGENRQEDDSEVVEERADNFIDDFLGMPEGNEATVEEGKSLNLDTVSTGEEEVEEEQAVWRGAVSMPDEGVFTGKIRQVAGRTMGDKEVFGLFPSSHSLIEGRLPSASAAPYLVQSRVAPRTELVVWSLELSWEPDSLTQIPFDAPSNEAENQESFERLLSYFQRRDRYGVLPSHPDARGTFVKDFYIVPLPKHCNIPQWLELMDSVEFQGEAQHTRKGDMFLLVAVLFKQSTVPRREDYSLPLHQQQSNLAFSPPGHAGLEALSTTPNIGNLLGGSGSSTLQDLLKAVGGNRSPSTPLGAAGYQSPTTQASQILAAPSATAHPSIEALSEMPKSQLEDMLGKNPNLVDQLLKTLSGANKPTSSSSPRPPGPPPPPPPSLQAQGPSPQHLPYSMEPGPHYAQAYASSSYDYNYPSQPQGPFPPPGGGYQTHHTDRNWGPNPGHQVHQSGYGSPPNQYDPPNRGGYRGGHQAGRRRY